MLHRDPADVAAELYARGYTLTRDEATTLVADDPDTVAILLGIAGNQGELRHPADTAGPEWGPVGFQDTGPPQPTLEPPDTP